MVKEDKMLTEIKELLNVVMTENKKLLVEIKELKAEQKKLREEIQICNTVLYSLPLKVEVLN